MEGVHTMNHSHPILLSLRTISRKLGVLGTIKGTLGRFRDPSAYEEKFGSLVMSYISEGDVIWDVGANVGHYTRKFAERVGPSGHIVAFEPSPRTFRMLVESMTDLTNVTCVNCALADFDGEADFHAGDDDVNPTNGLAAESIASPWKTCTVKVQRGISFLERHPELSPDHIKIDVEGFELEVLEGMKQALAEQSLRGIYLEVHFGVLAARDRQNSPTRIAAMIKDAGFVSHWADPSHLCGRRNSVQ